jgi:hypothetical protein
MYGVDRCIVYYEELWYSVEDLETKMLLKFKMIRGGRLHTNEVLVDRGPDAVSGVCVCVSLSLSLCVRVRTYVHAYTFIYLCVFVWGFILFVLCIQWHAYTHTNAHTIAPPQPLFTQTLMDYVCIAETLAQAKDLLSHDERPPELFLCHVRLGKIVTGMLRHTNTSLYLARSLTHCLCMVLFFPVHTHAHKHSFNTHTYAHTHSFCW